MEATYHHLTGLRQDLSIKWKLPLASASWSAGSLDHLSILRGLQECAVMLSFLCGCWRSEHEPYTFRVSALIRWAIFPPWIIFIYLFIDILLVVLRSSDVYHVQSKRRKKYSFWKLLHTAIWFRHPAHSRERWPQFTESVAVKLFLSLPETQTAKENVLFWLTNWSCQPVKASQKQHRSSPDWVVTIVTNEQNMHDVNVISWQTVMSPQELPEREGEAAGLLLSKCWPS